LTDLKVQVITRVHVLFARDRKIVALFADVGDISCDREDSGTVARDRETTALCADPTPEAHDHVKASACMP
jgi:hypothetical protein